MAGTCDDCGKLPEVFLLYWMGRAANEKVTLQKARRTWHSSDALPPMQVTRTWSRWRSARGYKIHRAKHAALYRDSWRGEGAPARMVVTWLCGNAASFPIPFREECAEGTSPCGKCEGLYAQMSGK